MRHTLLLILITLLPLASFAVDGSKRRFNLHGYYGYGMGTATDLNTLQSAFVAPKPGDITSYYYYGAGLGFMFSQRFELAAEYEILQAKNLATNNNGFVVDEADVWIDANYYLYRGRVSFYLGAGVGIPMTQKVTRQLSGVKTEYIGDKSLNYEGVLGADWALGSRVSILLEAAYKTITSAYLKTAAGSQLNTAAGAAAKLDLSGLKVAAGLALHF